MCRECYGPMRSESLELVGKHKKKRRRSSVGEVPCSDTGCFERIKGTGLTLDLGDSDPRSDAGTENDHSLNCQKQEYNMKSKLAAVLCTFTCMSVHASDSLPKFYDNISISGIETWPNAANPTYGYTVKMNNNLSTTGCTSSTVFSVLSGEFQDETLSVLLAAMVSGKQIRIRVAECSDRPLVDRVEIKN